MCLHSDMDLVRMDYEVEEEGLLLYCLQSFICFMIRIIILMISLPISQVRPVYPGGQLHRKDPVGSSKIHDPPF